MTLTEKLFLLLYIALMLVFIFGIPLAIAVIHAQLTKRHRIRVFSSVNCDVCGGPVPVDLVIHHRIFHSCHKRRCIRKREQMEEGFRKAFNDSSITLAHVPKPSEHSTQITLSYGTKPTDHTSEG